jgi:hypothetical protein
MRLKELARTLGGCGTESFMVSMNISQRITPCIFRNDNNHSVDTTLCKIGPHRKGGRRACDVHYFREAVAMDNELN